MRPVNEQTVQGYTRFNDINTQPALLLRVDHYRADNVDVMERGGVKFIPGCCDIRH